MLRVLTFYDQKSLFLAVLTRQTEEFPTKIIVPF